MADAKIDIKIGNIAFSGEGDKAWLAEQLDKILDRAVLMGDTSQYSDETDDSDEDSGDTGTQLKVTLANFLKSTTALSNQTKKFLATAVWLDGREGKKKRVTGDVIKALENNHQKKLGNPSQCLSNNIKQGYCEKKGKQFYVTDEGRKSLD